MPSLLETRRAFLATLGAALPAVGAASRKNQPAVNPPNIVMLLADELPASQLGCYGGKVQKTPHIDLLARRGVRFQNALACSRGGAIGRATLFTGRTALQPPSASDVYLTDLLAAQGYDVGHVGPWGLGDDAQPAHGINWHQTVIEPGDPGMAARKAVEFLDRQRTGGKPFFLSLTNPASTGAVEFDQQVQAVVAKLHQISREENTLIVVTSTGSTAEALHIPLIFCWPGHAPVEAARPDLVGSYDLLYTLCAAADVVPPNRNLCGRSYLPLVQGRPFAKKRPWRTMLYGSFTDGSGTADTASDNRFQLILRNDGKGPNTLLDLRADPSRASINQYTNRAFVTTRDLLRRNLNQWKTQYSH